MWHQRYHKQNQKAETDAQESPSPMSMQIEENARGCQYEKTEV